MKVVKRVSEKIPFEKVSYGEVFKYDEQYYMKLAGEFYDKTEGYNAVLLDDGEVYHLTDDDLVETVYGEFKIY